MSLSPSQRECVHSASGYYGYHGVVPLAHTPSSPQYMHCVCRTLVSSHTCMHTHTHTHTQIIMRHGDRKIVHERLIVLPNTIS